MLYPLKHVIRIYKLINVVFRPFWLLTRAQCTILQIFFGATLLKSQNTLFALPCGTSRDAIHGQVFYCHQTSNLKMKHQWRSRYIQLPYLEPFGSLFLRFLIRFLVKLFVSWYDMINIYILSLVLVLLDWTSIKFKPNSFFFLLKFSYFTYSLFLALL